MQDVDTNNSCKVCNATFTRPEHLARHSLLHRGHKPFSCTRCNFRSSRKDTLHRHKVAFDHHEDNGRSTERRSRSRIRRACRTCAAVKQRCDGKNPCTRCQTKSLACYYPAVGSSQVQRQQGDLTPYSAQGSVETDKQQLGDTGPSLSYGICQLQEPSSSSTTLDEIQAPMPIGVDAGANALSSHYSFSGLPEIDPLAFLDTSAESMEPFWGCYWSEAGQPTLEWLLPPLSSFPEANVAVPTQSATESSNESSTTGGDWASPVVSFVGSRSSPEPQKGQALRFNDILRKASGEVDNTQSGGGDCSDTDSFPTSITGPGTEIWVAEDFGHVRQLPALAYEKMISSYGSLNRDDGHYRSFANGDFPSLAAMNVFMQLYFEETYHLLPFLHRPTFDPAEEHWILILALATVGCRFSQAQGAMICARLLQEFLRRALRMTTERDYSMTYEPWFLQASLLHQICMQTSVNISYIETAQAERGFYSTLLRKINSASRQRNERPSNVMKQAAEDIWKSWIKREKMWRLAYTTWVIDSQFNLFYDLDPLVPTDLMRAPLPCLERVWEAPTAAIWQDELSRQGAYQPSDLRLEKDHIYRSQTRRDCIGDFAALVLLLAIFGDIRLMQKQPPAAFSTSMSLESRPRWVETAYECLDILCPDDLALTTEPSLKPVLMHHKHLIGVLIHVSLRDLVCFSGWRVTRQDVSEVRERLRLWLNHKKADARRVVLHAGRLFALLRTAGGGGHYEPRGMLIACLTLWANAELQDDAAEDNGAGETVVPVRLDRSLDKTAAQDWLDGSAARARPYLAGVGAISGPTAARRIIREGARIMGSRKAWPIGHVMGVAITIQHSMLSNSEIRGQD